MITAFSFWGEQTL